MPENVFRKMDFTIHADAGNVFFNMLWRDRSENNERGKFSRKKYYVCKKCHDRVYVKTSTFQEFLNKALGKR